jgi:hypothetical protein
MAWPCATRWPQDDRSASNAQHTARASGTRDGRDSDISRKLGGVIPDKREATTLFPGARARSEGRDSEKKSRLSLQRDAIYSNWSIEAHLQSSR